jgi:hypothetical protein
MPVGKEEIRNRLGFHGTTDESTKKHEQLREMFIAFAEYLDETLPDGRAKSTALTKIQESSMWAHFGVAEQNPVVSPPLAQPKPRPTPIPAPKAGRSYLG